MAKRLNAKCGNVGNHRNLFRRYIEPRWGRLRLGSIRTVEVEEWLHSLPMAPASKAKLKCVLSVLYNHAIRYEWLTFNPISRVRTSQKRLRDKDVLTPDEFQKLVQNLSVRDRAMVGHGQVGGGGGRGVRGRPDPGIADMQRPGVVIARGGDGRRHEKGRGEGAGYKRCRRYHGVQIRSLGLLVAALWLRNRMRNPPGRRSERRGSMALGSAMA